MSTKQTMPEESQLLFYKRLYLALSFLVPFLILGTVFALLRVYPFGDRQILITDFWQQYYPFMSDYWHKLREGSSLIWSWTAGSGGNYLPLIAYYLASPLNFLIVLFPHAWLREVLTVILLIKIGCAGLFMGIYLQSICKRYEYAVPVFASLYALCAFTLGYFWNIMWFDSFAIFPLVMLGQQALMREGKTRLYILPLALAVLINFYIGFYICIFVLIMFFSHCFMLKVNLWEFACKLALIAICSVIALGLTAALTLPAFFSLQNTHTAASTFPSSFRLYNSFFDVLGNFIAFTPPTSKEGLPNLYSGMISVLLAAVFVSSSKIALREKLAFLIILAFMVISCNVNVLDYIWNGFQFTNMLPFRFSFIVSFVLAAAAYRAYPLLREIKTRELLAVGLTASLFLLMAQFGSQETAYIIRSAVLCAGYLLLFVAYKRMKADMHRLLNVVLMVVILAEVSITAFIGVAAAGSSGRSPYPDKYEQVQQLLDMREPAGSSFYRTEFTNWYTHNDTSLYGFDGVSLFSSTVNVSVTKFMGGLGLHAWEAGNRYNYAETSPLTSAFLNIRYLIIRNGNPAHKGVYWNSVGEAGGPLLLENNRYLPFGFMVNEETAGYVHERNNPFISQNELFRRATGLEEDLFTYIDIIHVGHRNYHVTRSDLGEYNYTLNDGEKDGAFKWNYEMPFDAMIYAYCRIDNVNNARVTVGGETQRTIENRRPYIFTVGEFAEGDLVSIEADASAKSGKASIYVGYINQELFDQGYARLSDETLALTKFTETNIIGTVTASKDGLLYTSIPYEKGWEAFVDGVPAEILLIDGCMAAVRVSEGVREIEFRYKNSGLMIGAAISVLSLLALIALELYKRRKSF